MIDNNIFNNLISEISSDLSNANKYNNSDNFSDYSNRKSPDYNRGKDNDITSQRINNTDWRKESDYYNSRHVYKSTKHKSINIEESLKSINGTIDNVDQNYYTRFPEWVNWDRRRNVAKLYNRPFNEEPPKR